MSKSSQAFFDATERNPDSHMPENEPCFCAELPPEFQADLDRVAVLNQQFNKIFGEKPMPF